MGLSRCIPADPFPSTTPRCTDFIPTPRAGAYVRDDDAETIVDDDTPRLTQFLPSVLNISSQSFRDQSAHIGRISCFASTPRLDLFAPVAHTYVDLAPEADTPIL